MDDEDKGLVVEELAEAPTVEAPVETTEAPLYLARSSARQPARNR